MCGWQQAWEHRARAAGVEVRDAAGCSRCSGRASREDADATVPAANGVDAQLAKVLAQAASRDNEAGARRPWLGFDKRGCCVPRVRETYA